ncbi:MAG: Rpn family recombination-promoting nuclease/putative transposase [Lachnospiraceae bacterium]|nr:Rpn family recombination-promoting nuclease/putative transposase [Candidatus Merdinaster equi]
MQKNNTNSAPHGHLPFRMTNDFIFKILLQEDENKDILIALICASLKNVSFEDIKSVQVLNPIEIGDTFDSKTMILDVKAILNNNTIYNLEMQVVNNYDWPERSVTYLCRCFDKMTVGEKYIEKCGAYHISFLDYSLFPDEPEFCADYRIANVGNGRIYTSKFGLTVIDLTKSYIATPDDRERHLDLWALFFKATTWEDLQMLAEKDEYINTAYGRILRLSEDEKMRQLAEARQDQLMQLNDFKYHFMQEIAEKDASIAEKDASIAEKDAEIQALRAELDRLKNNTNE